MFKLKSRLKTNFINFTNFTNEIIQAIYALNELATFITHF